MRVPKIASPNRTRYRAMLFAAALTFAATVPAWAYAQQAMPEPGGAATQGTSEEAAQGESTQGAQDAPQAARPPRHDYPTSVRADYVIGCLAANGFQRQLLDKCACSIDAIADQMSYDDYERAETILSMQQASVGPRGGLFRDTPVAKTSMEQLRRAQAEANLRCGG